MPTETELANLALMRLGGAGDQETGSGFISDIDGTDQISKWCKTLLPVCRRKAIADAAATGCPFPETKKYADLGAEVAEANLPTIGGWDYAFNVPTDCLALVAQIDEDFDTTADERTEYRYEIIANKANNGRLLLTNDLTNEDEDSAYIEYSVDIPNPNGFSEDLKNCIVTLLAAELCPLINKKLEIRQGFLVEYEQLVKIEAKGFNQSQLNNYVKTIPDYLGGRTV